MGEQSISQAEIDALIRGAMQEEETPPVTSMAPEDLNRLRAPLAEFFSTAFPAMSSLADLPCEGAIADLALTTIQEVSNLGSARILVGETALSGGLTGPAYYVIPLALGTMMISQLRHGETVGELNEESCQPLSAGLERFGEGGCTSVSSLLGQPVTAGAVRFTAAAKLPEVVTEPPDSRAVTVGVDLAVGDAMGRMLLVLPERVLLPLVQVLRGKQTPSILASAPITPIPQPPAIAIPTSSPLAQPVAAVMPESPLAPAGSISPVVFPSLTPAVAPEAPRNIDLLMDVSLKVTVEIGRTRRQIKEVLSLGPGFVLELDRLANEQVDVLVNGKLIAKAEVVVVDENYGARITEIVSPRARIQAMG